MKRVWIGLLAVVVAIAAVTALAPVAFAGEGIDVHGMYSVTDVGQTVCAPVGSTGFMFRCDTAGLVSEYTGGNLIGAAVADFTSLVNCATLREVGHGTETFSGTLGGVAGTLSWTDQFSADVLDCTSFLPFNLDIQSVAVKGAGGLAGLQGKIAFTDTDFAGSLH